MQVWQAIAKDSSLRRHDRVLICEDDAELLPAWRGIIDGLSRYDIVLLGCYNPMAPDYYDSQVGHNEALRAKLALSPHTTALPHRRILATPEPSRIMGTAAYVVSKEAAAELTAYDGSVGWAIDDWVEWRWRGFTIGEVYPGVARERAGTTSDIHGIVRPAPTPGETGPVKAKRLTLRQRAFFMGEHLRAALPLTVRRMWPPYARIYVRKSLRLLVSRARSWGRRRKE